MADNAASKRPGDAVDLNDGLPKDPARARFWLKKVVDGPFSLSLWPLPARRLLEELDSAGD